MSVKQIQIGNRIASERKKRKKTQEELAFYIGVSKAAVSKWESGQSYPDITLLPLLAAYFNISIDELVGYEPQLCKEDIRKLYIRLSEEVKKKEFSKVYEECNQYVKKYYSCWSLQFHMALFLLNNAALAGESDKVEKMIEEAIIILDRVTRNHEDFSMAKQAKYVQANCYLQLKEPAKVIDLLDEEIDIPASKNVILAMAYEMKGDTSKAIELLQSYLYNCIMGIVTTYSNVLQLYMGNEQKMELHLRCLEDLCDAYQIKQMHPANVAAVYLNTAYCYIQMGDNDKAIKYLEKYTDILTQKGCFPLKLKGNEIFDQLNSYFENLDLGTAMPRDEEMVKKDMKSIILDSPIWEPIKEDASFKKICMRLKLI